MHDAILITTIAVLAFLGGLELALNPPSWRRWRLGRRRSHGSIKLPRTVLDANLLAHSIACRWLPSLSPTSTATLNGDPLGRYIVLVHENRKGLVFLPFPAPQRLAEKVEEMMAAQTTDDDKGVVN